MNWFKKRNEKAPKERINLAADVLEKAADKIEQYGWIKNDLGSKKTGYCAMGAINAAQREIKGAGPATARVSKEAVLWDARKTRSVKDMYSRMPNMFNSPFYEIDSYVAMYNDADAPNAQVIVRRMRRAAKYLRQEF